MGCSPRRGRAESLRIVRQKPSQTRCFSYRSISLKHDFCLSLKVTHSTAGGVKMMRGYPDVDKYSGVENCDWLPAKKWLMMRVLDDMQHWKFTQPKHTETSCSW
eukprot:4709810-Pleurochrysis_carterae.AAC.1